MLATECRVTQSRTANRNQFIQGSFVTLLSWHIRQGQPVPSTVIITLIISTQKRFSLWGKHYLGEALSNPAKGGVALHQQTKIKSSSCCVTLTDVCARICVFLFVLGLAGYSPLASSTPLSKVSGYISFLTCSCTTCRKKEEVDHVTEPSSRDQTSSGGLWGAKTD